MWSARRVSERCQEASAHKELSELRRSANEASEEDRWAALREEILQGEEADMGGDVVDKVAGDLTFPQLPSTQGGTKRVKHTRRVGNASNGGARTAEKSVGKGRQQTTLTTATLSERDMERFFTRYDDSDGEGDVDVHRLLQDMEAGEQEEADADGVVPTANELLATLTRGGRSDDGASRPAEGAGRCGTGETMQQAATGSELQVEHAVQHVPSLLVPLVDERLDYNSFADEKKAAARGRVAEREGGSGASDTVNYLVIHDDAADTQQRARVAVVGLSSKAGITSPEVTAQRANTTVPSSNLPGALFYWLDAKEQTHSLSVDPGSVFLFGKLHVHQSDEDREGHFVSCCLRVRDMYRCVYLLPSPTSSDAEVVQEVNALCRAYGVEERRIRFVDRYYAFENTELPRERARWAKLRYPARYLPLPASALARQGCCHVSAMLGANTSLLELFLLKRKLRGPCYLDVSQLTAVTSRISHCAAEYAVNSPKHVHVSLTALARPPPPLTLLGLQLFTQLDEKKATTEVVAAALTVYDVVNIDNAVPAMPDKVSCAIRPLRVGVPLPLDLEPLCAEKGITHMHRCANERALLAWLAKQVGQLDADILIGHNFAGFTLPTLLDRFQELNVPGWSTLGRLDLKRLPRVAHGSTGASVVEREVCVGRLVADSYLLAREYYKSVNYKLLALAEQMHLRGILTNSAADAGTILTTRADGMLESRLPEPRLHTNDEATSSRELCELLMYTLNNAALAVAVVAHLDVLRLTRRLTNIAGNLWSRTLYGARSERIEYLLLHTFHDLKFITPDRRVMEAKRPRDGDDDGDDEKRRKARYQGGMVLEPKCGLYADFTLLLDFNSLYPSLIQEFNICFTTVDRTDATHDAEIPSPEQLICASCAAANLEVPCAHKCVLPKVIKGLVDSRREVKRLMKNEKDGNLLALLEIRQKALKLTANSMYGCLGFEHSRFHAQPLAELVTRQGRLALQNTVDLIPQINPSLRVIYGDTDSVMIQTGIKNDIKAVRELGLELKAKINKRYRSLEIDIDGIFRAILLLKKKKYAALSVVDWQDAGTHYVKEIKGLDMVRRDWCPLSKKVSDAVLNRVLNAEGSEDILDYIMSYMHDVAEHVRRGDRYILDDFVISKSLTKEPEAYRAANAASFPHAIVALRMKERKELVRVGDLIPYVICVGDKLADKAYHVDEVRHNTNLRLDAEWYLSSQIYPPVMRLCEHIQGFSSVQLSEAMGIVCHGNTAVQARSHDQQDETATQLSDFSHCAMFKNVDLAECFPDALHLQVVCTHCLRKTPIDPHQRIRDVLHQVGEGQLADEKFDLYVCVSCGRSLAVDYVANCFTQMCYKLMRRFYANGGGATAVREIRSQFTYFRALFDVPHAPGCAPAVKYYHRSLARRCLGMDRRLYTLAETETPAIRETVDPVDPLCAAADMFYKRIDHMFINLSDLFGAHRDTS